MSDLTRVVDERHAALGSEPQTVAARDFGPIDRQQILHVIGLDPGDPKAMAVVAVAERYGLDPVLGHIDIYPRSARPYITRDGYLHIAHRSPQFDGMRTVDGPKRDSGQWFCTVAVYRKDMSHPFIYTGRADTSSSNGWEMAIARAERRALKRAFDVAVPLAVFGGEDDDMDRTPTVDKGSGPISVPASEPAPAVGVPHADLDQPGIQDVPLPEPTEPQSDEQTDPRPTTPPEPERRSQAREHVGEPVSGGQRRAIFALLGMLGIDSNDRDARLSQVTAIVDRPIESTNDLSYIEAAQVIHALGRQVRDMEIEMAENDGSEAE